MGKLRLLQVVIVVSALLGLLALGSSRPRRGVLCRSV